MNYHDLGLKIKFLNIKNLISNIKMDQNSGLKAPKKLACLLVKKCGNNGLELGNIKLITLYNTVEHSELNWKTPERAFFFSWFITLKSSSSSSIGSPPTSSLLYFNLPEKCSLWPEMIIPTATVSLWILHIVGSKNGKKGCF